MKIIKKMFAVLLLVVLLVGLAGCGKQHSSDNTGEDLPPQTTPESDGGSASELDFNEIELAELSAPYDALTVEYEGGFYYIDAQGNLCRTTTDMTDYELYYYAP